MKKLIAVLVVTHWACYTFGHIKGWDARTREAESVRRTTHAMRT